ncbi:MAG TPA: glycine cleavage system protein GcvH [Kofleriaceae bacterium]|nr:glycine cleavage system protein GcvH [Kofleriaceae bacterium]
MANLPSDLRYTKDHEWIRDNGDGTCTVGITEFAQQQLGDIVFVDVPSVGKKLEAEDVFGTVESVKSVSDLFLPVGAEILEINAELESEPELINTEPYGDGWIAKIKPGNPADLNRLFDAESYQKLLDSASQ